MSANKQIEYVDPKYIGKEFWSKIPKLKKYFSNKFYCTCVDLPNGCTKMVGFVSIMFEIKTTFDEDFNEALNKITAKFSDHYYNGRIFHGLLSQPLLIKQKDKNKYIISTYPLLTGYERELLNIK